MNIAIIQTPLKWEDPEFNRAVFERKLSFIKEDTDIVILPETFTTGFSMLSTDLAEKMDGKSVKWMKKMAKEHKIRLIGSLIIQEKKQYFNRLLVVGPNGIEAQYNKRHLFTMAKEDKYYTAGKERTIWEYKGFKFLLQICYDLRFPVFSRNQNDYDAAIYIANWPEVRNTPWKTLLRARSMENQCFVLACNRIGKDGNGMTYSGDSAAIDPMGEDLITIPSHQEGIFYTQLSKEILKDCRKRFPVLEDQDEFKLKS